MYQLYFIRRITFKKGMEMQNMEERIVQCQIALKVLIYYSLSHDQIYYSHGKS